MLKWINKKRNQKGFTLIELIVVIAILGILAAIAIPRLGLFRDDANQAAYEANWRTVESAVQMYIASNGAPSSDITGLDITDYINDPTLTLRAPGSTNDLNFIGTVDLSTDGSWTVSTTPPTSP